jgi:hypothetical protein
MKTFWGAVVGVFLSQLIVTILHHLVSDNVAQVLLVVFSFVIILGILVIDYKKQE